MEKVRILSFDPGTANLGYSLIEGTHVEDLSLTAWRGVLETSKKDGDLRTRVDKLGNHVPILIDATKPHYIAIEDFDLSGTSSRQTDIAMATLVEHLRMVCRKAGYEPTIYTNPEWKQIITGQRGLNKNQIQHLVKHRVKGTDVLGSRQADTHIWDTVGIGYAKFIELHRG